MTILYVDEISGDKSLAATTNTLSVAFNLAAFNIPEIKGRCPVFTAGRYLCVLLPATPPVMYILELRSNPQLAKMLIKSLGLSAEVIIQLTGIIKLYNQTYDENKNNVVLVLDKPSSGFA